MTLPAESLTTWNEVYEKFMGKFYSYQKTTTLRQQISTFAQYDDEPFHEAWDRFKQLLVECLYHSYSNELLNQFFYNGLTLTGQCMVDGAAGGTIGNKKASETRKLFEMLGANSQQKNVRSVKRGGAQAAHAATGLEQQVAQLTKSVQQLWHLGPKMNTEEGTTSANCAEKTGIPHYIAHTA